MEAGSLGSSPSLPSLLFPVRWEFPISGPRGDLVLVSLTLGQMPLWVDLGSQAALLWAHVPTCPWAGAQGLSTTTVQCPV